MSTISLKTEPNLSMQIAPMIPCQESKEVLELYNGYDIFFISPHTGLEDVNIFLLGENHDSQECKELNGNFISKMARNEQITVFIEGSPFSSPFAHPEKYKPEKYIDPCCSVVFYGWDVSSEIMSTIGNPPRIQRLVVEGLRGVYLTMRKLMKEMIKCKESQAKLEKAICNSSNKIEEEKFSKMLDDKKDRAKLIAIKFRELQESEIKLEKEIGIGVASPESVRETFPARTKAMVTTLQQLRSERCIEGKIFFIAGAAHLKTPETDVAIEEYNLESLHEELLQHKAAILIPKMILTNNNSLESNF